MISFCLCADSVLLSPKPRKRRVVNGEGSDKLSRACSVLARRDTVQRQRRNQKRQGLTRRRCALRQSGVPRPCRRAARARSLPARRLRRAAEHRRGAEVSRAGQRTGACGRIVHERRRAPLADVQPSATASAGDRMSVAQRFRM